MNNPFKVGDHVYHHSKERGHFPAVVEKVGRAGRVKITDVGWVSAHKCELQSEWAKREGTIS